MGWAARIASARQASMARVAASAGELTGSLPKAPAVVRKRTSLPRGVAKKSCVEINEVSGWASVARPCPAECQRI